MAKCGSCKQKLAKNQPCPNCGVEVGSFNCKIKTPEGKTSVVTMSLFKNFLVINGGKSAIRLLIETSFYYLFGALIGIILDLIGDVLIKVKLGYINTNDIYSVVFSSPVKKKVNFKIVLVNGTEIVGEGIKEKYAATVIGFFRTAGINVVMGTPADTLYTNPYTYDMDDIKFGVCPAAAQFVKIEGKQKLMPPIENLVISNNQ